ncbi:hypothetical protein [Methylobacterium sp. Leaf117]|uniref:hypothetical protein n=1 Tax=Methylobacterium sp. Leaf117 TaxID=1736260 RepID=UPI0006F52EE0|nr:hypothetical protein [Methylobacterium sp. Leaf117]KQP90791.1 hypothetical protein ASF57_23580 [Methylobacterium sp. Leaf117]
MTARIENWWIRVREEDGSPGILQLAEVAFEGSEPRQVNFMNTCVTLMPEDMGKLTLVEQVIPPGRVLSDFIHPHWTDLFNGPEAYMAWREAQHVGAVTTEVAISPKALDPCSDEEIEAWETWAKDQGFDMEEHPLHYLFMNKQTSSARKGWKAGLEFARRIVQGQA